MEGNELLNLHNRLISEPISKKTYFCLKDDHIEDGYAEWGWSENLDCIRDNFLYVFVLGNMAMYNGKKKINRISNDLIVNLINDEQCNMEKVIEVETKFIILWKDVKDCNDFKRLKEKSKNLCEYLTLLGYELNFGLYKNAKEAVKIAQFLDSYLPDGEEGFGSFLRQFVEENY